MTWQAFTLGFWYFPPFFSADPLKVCEVGWGPSVHSHFQVSPEISDWVQVRALTWQLKDIHRVVPKPLLRCLGCVLRVIVLLEGKPLAESEVLSTHLSTGIGQVMRGACFPPDMTPSGLSCVFHWGKVSVSPCCHKAQISGVEVMVVLLEVSPPLGSWSPLLPPFSSNCSVWPASQL